jgi:hypothetical protein
MEELQYREKVDATILKNKTSKKICPLGSERHVSPEHNGMINFSYQKQAF